MSKELNIKQLISCLAVFLGFLLLIAGHSPGIAMPVFIGMLLVLLWLNLRGTEAVKDKRGWLVAPVIWLLSFHWFVSSSMMFKWLNWPVITFLSIFMCLVLSGQWTLRTRLFATLERFFFGYVMPFKFFHLPFIGRFKNSKSKNLRGIVFGLLFSVPVLVVLIAALSSGDMVFSRIVKQAIDSLDRLIKLPNLLNIFQALLLALYALGLLMFTLSAPERSYLTDIKKPRFNSIALIMVQMTFVLVYAAFTYVQFAYLFGQSPLPFDLSYAEYARRGFFEMIALSLLNFCFVLPVSYFMRDAEHGRTIKLLSSLICGFTLVLLASSFFRMFLYEQRYGYTTLRLLVYAFIIFEAVSVLLTLIYIFNEKFNVTAGYAAVALMVYLVLNFANIDSIIARRNISMSEANRLTELDERHLTQLSWDAVPAIAEYALDKPQSSLYGYLKRVKATLLRARQDQSLQELNLSEINALRSLESLELTEAEKINVLYRSRFPFD